MVQMNLNYSTLINGSTQQGIGADLMFPYFTSKQITECMLHYFVPCCQCAMLYVSLAGYAHT